MGNRRSDHIIVPLLSGFPLQTGRDSRQAKDLMDKPPFILYTVSSTTARLLTGRATWSFAPALAYLQYARAALFSGHGGRQCPE